MNNAHAKKMMKLFDRYEETFREPPPTWGYGYDDMEKEITEAIETNTPIECENDRDVVY